jgi:hypothetical protein
MSVQSFIPTIWAASVLCQLEKASVYGSCLSRDYSGELKQVGDTVKIPIVGAVAVRPYTRNADISYDQATGSTLDIVIDNCSYWALKADDLDVVAQSKPAFIDACTKSAGYALRDAVDVDAAEVLATGAGNKLFEAAPFQVNGNVTRLLAEISKTLDTANVPRSGRWAVLPPFVAAELSLELIGKATPDTQIVSEGWINRCFGMEIFMSNNCPEDTDGNSIVLAGVREAGTLIAQVEKTEAMRDPNSFAELVRGLLLWKTAVLLSAGLVSAAVTPAT